MNLVKLLSSNVLTVPAALDSLDHVGRARCQEQCGAQLEAVRAQSSEITEACWPDVSTVVHSFSRVRVWAFPCMYVCVCVRLHLFCSSQTSIAQTPFVDDKSRCK